MKENDPLFSLIDEYFCDDPYEFEPNMKDGRYVFLPENVSHQGIGICVSKSLPGFLEVGHFWYPEEYTEKSLHGYGQVYIPMFSLKPGPELVNMIRNVYMDGRSRHDTYCTFPFFTDVIVTLEGYFLDRTEASIRTIRSALEKQNLQIQRNGEGLISFMQHLSKEIQ